MCAAQNAHIVLGSGGCLGLYSYFHAVRFEKPMIMIDNALDSNIYLQPEVSAHLNISIFICFILIQSDLENLLR